MYDDSFMAHSERWVKLRLHRRHPTIVDLAEHMGCSPEDALACAIDWFRQLDQFPDANKAYSKLQINVAAGSPPGQDFAESAAHVGWLERSGSKWVPAELFQWISEPAKRRVRRDMPVVDERRASDPPLVGHNSAQSRVESDEIDSTGSEVKPRTSTDSALQEATAMEIVKTHDEQVKVLRDRGLPGLTKREQIEVNALIQRTGIAKNNSGAALNYIRNVIPDGAAFLRRVMQQAVDQGLVEGSPHHARYVFKSIKSQAMAKSKPIEGA